MTFFFYLDTLRFYQALRMCGTDFTLIARVFPNRDRDDIKRKFKTEDKANRTLVDSALRKMNKKKFFFNLLTHYSRSTYSI
jgi:transcription factor TFIIIB component B''